MEKLKAQFPNSRIILTFFSPSGYEIRKNYQGADWVFYMPMDSAANAKRFFDVVDPSLVVFVKYDYWYYYLTACKKRNIPLLMISVIFRKDQPFFKWYGGLHKKMLDCFTCFFVQDESSQKLLQSLQIKNVLIAGDTRFDRVAEIAASFQPIEAVEKFCGNSTVLVAGSTWPADEKLIKEAISSFPDLKLIIAPHEIHKEHIKQLRSTFPNAMLFSELITGNQQPATSNHLIIDNIGLLSRLYYYATITYVGGGFNKGIHNTLEAAVYGKPVIIGPVYKKFKEAVELVETGSGIVVTDGSSLIAALQLLSENKKEYDRRSKNSFDFVQQKRGATGIIVNYIQENLRFTN